MYRYEICLCGYWHDPKSGHAEHCAKRSAEALSYGQQQKTSILDSRRTAASEL